MFARAAAGVSKKTGRSTAWTTLTAEFCSCSARRMDSALDAEALFALVAFSNICRKGTLHIYVYRWVNAITIQLELIDPFT